jgi:hypothetical protein
MVNAEMKNAANTPEMIMDNATGITQSADCQR